MEYASFLGVVLWRYYIQYLKFILSDYHVTSIEIDSLETEVDYSAKSLNNQYCSPNGQMILTLFLGLL
jgi:hypothetical protein